MKINTHIIQLSLLGLAWALAVGCGGKTLTAHEQAGSTDAGVDQGVADGSHDVQPPWDGGSDVLPYDAPPEAAVDTGGDAPDASCPCWCKNWLQNDVSTYPSGFFFDEINPSGACVVHGCPSGFVCCAMSCVDPSVCVYDGAMTGEIGCGWIHDGIVPLPKDNCCWHYGYVACVLPEKCAPMGVLRQGVYDKEKNGKVPVCAKYQGCNEEPDE